MEKAKPRTTSGAFPCLSITYSQPIRINILHRRSRPNRFVLKILREIGGRGGTPEIPPQQFVIRRPHHLVALAGDSLQPWPVHDSPPSPRIIDQALSLNLSRRNRYRR